MLRLHAAPQEVSLMLMTIVREAYYHTPDAFQRAILVRRRERIWKEAGIVFIHVPKAAGTSVNAALYGRFVGHVRAVDVEHWGSSAIRRLPRFSIVRNPWERLVSAYRFARRGSGIGGLIQAGVRRPEQYRGPEFRSFEAFVREWLAPRRLKSVDPIFQQQHTFVCGAGGQLLVDHLGRVENLHSTLEFIKTALGTAVMLQRSNRSGTNVDYRHFYTSELVDIVGELYCQDVQIFGYRP
jgi:chondroitin 4-sulfotransferase 11